jgi:hypothetical protein
MTKFVIAVALFAIVALALGPAHADPSAPSPVPFQLIEDKAAVPVTIDGSGPFTIAIDSGSETMSISQKIVDACKLTTKTGTVAVSGTSGGYVGVAQASVGAVRIGASEVDRPFCTVDPKEHAVDGLIGAPLFNAYTVQIDFGNKTVTCYAPGGYRPDPGDVAIPITLGLHRVPVVRALLGSTPVMLEIDTGSSFPCELYAPVVTANNLTAKYVYEGEVSRDSVAGPVVSGVYAITDLSLSSAPSSASADDSRPLIKLPAIVPAFFFPSGQISEGNWDGRLGEPVFAGMVLTLDYANSRMYIRPSQPAAMPIPAQASSIDAP